MKIDRRTFINRSSLALLSGSAALMSACGPADRSAEARITGDDAGRRLEFWMWESRRNWTRIAHEAGLPQIYPDIAVDFVSLDRGQVRSKFLTSLVAEVGLPDICRCDLAWYRSLVAAGGAIDLTSTVATHRQDIIPSVYESFIIDGKIYGVPQDVLVYQIGYRTDLFRRAGFPTDPHEVAQLWSTYDDYIRIGRELKRKTGAFLVNIDPTENLWNYDVVQLAGSTGQFDKHLNVNFDSDFHIAATEVWKRLFNSGIASTFSYNSPQFWESVKADAQATRIWGGVDDYRTRDFAPAQMGRWRITKLPSVTADAGRISGGPANALIVPGQSGRLRRELAVDVAEFIGLNKAATVPYSKVFLGNVSAHIPCLRELQHTPSPALDQQSTIGWILQMLETEDLRPWYRSSIHFPLALRAQKDAVFRILTENAPVARTLKEAADRVRKMQRLTGTA